MNLLFEKNKQLVKIPLNACYTNLSESNEFTVPLGVISWASFDGQVVVKVRKQNLNQFLNTNVKGYSGIFNNHIKNIKSMNKEKYGSDELIHYKDRSGFTFKIVLNNTSNENNSKLIFEVNEQKEAQILAIELKDDEGHVCTEFFANQDICIHITISNHCEHQDARLNFSILDKYENLIFITRRNLDFKGTKTWIVKVPKDNLIANNYIIGLALDIPKIKLLDFPDRKMNLNIVNILPKLTQISNFSFVLSQYSPGGGYQKQTPVPSFGLQRMVTGSAVRVHREITCQK